MLPVNAVGEPLAGKPHEWFDGRALENGAIFATAPALDPTAHVRF